MAEMLSIDISGDGIVNVKLLGACSGCPMAQITLKMGIKRYLKEKTPLVQGVISEQRCLVCLRILTPCFGISVCEDMRDGLCYYR